MNISSTECFPKKFFLKFVDWLIHHGPLRGRFILVSSTVMRLVFIGVEQCQILLQRYPTLLQAINWEPMWHSSREKLSQTTIQNRKHRTKSTSFNLRSTNTTSCILSTVTCVAIPTGRSERSASLVLMRKQHLVPSKPILDLSSFANDIRLKSTRNEHFSISAKIHAVAYF